MGVIDWTKPAGHIHNQVRGLIPWPCASTELGGATVKVFRTEVLGETGKAPGAVAAAGKAGIDVACGDGHLLRILELQPQGAAGWRRRTICGAIPCRWRHEPPGEAQRPGCGPGCADAGGQGQRLVR
ncbi:MAG: hypothetical protein ACLR5H_10250 [Oscillospiraceae bacterium]